MLCKICNEKFEDNPSGVGRFYTHLKFKHEISKKEYIVISEYNGVAPMCRCGCSEEAAWQNRHGFREYAKGHRRFKHRIEQYIKKAGIPMCSRPSCNKEAGFARAEPKEYCSISCSIKDKWERPEIYEFTEQERQRRSEFMKKRMKDKEYVDRIRDGISKYHSNCKKNGIKRMLSEEHKQKISVTAKERWKDPEMRAKMINRMKHSINNDRAELQRRSDFMKDKMKEAEYVNNVLSSIPKRFSKLHLKIREQLNLDQKGFIGEQVVGRYVVDELNEATKTIIEINGDYIHANPLMYSEHDIIRLPGNSYTAAEKWENDKKKLDDLKSMGYNVIVIWESDNINNIEI